VGESSRRSEGWRLLDSLRVGLAWDGSNRILCVDGVGVAKDTQGGLSKSIGGLYLGEGKNLEPGSFWSGLIDDVRIYDRAVKPWTSGGFSKGSTI
jgi:hypothetical protein